MISSTRGKILHFSMFYYFWRKVLILYCWLLFPVVTNYNSIHLKRWCSSQTYMSLHILALNMHTRNHQKFSTPPLFWGSHSSHWWNLNIFILIRHLFFDAVNSCFSSSESLLFSYIYLRRYIHTNCFYPSHADFFIFYRSEKWKD